MPHGTERPAEKGESVPSGMLGQIVATGPEKGEETCEVGL